MKPRQQTWVGRGYETSVANLGRRGLETSAAEWCICLPLFHPTASNIIYEQFTV